jgi:hypothetical protein
MPPRDGQLGTAKDGTPVRGTGKPPTTAELMQTPKYRDTRAAGQAKKDAAAEDEIEKGLAGYTQSKNDLRGLRQIVEQAPSGTFAGLRESLGKNFGDSIGGLAGVPTYEQAVALENLRGEGAKSVLGDVKKLPGPLSEKELAFLQQLQVNPSASKDRNRKVVDGAEWALNYKSNYLHGKQAWMNELGSPTAKNAKGQTYDQWWATWASDNLPVPDARTPTKRERQNGALKAKSQAAAPGGIRVLSVE